MGHSQTLARCHSALFASALALPFAEPLSVGARDLGLLALFGVGQFAAGFLLFTAGAPLIPPAEASLIGLLETVLGPLWVWLALNERPGVATLTGGALILAALLANALVGGATGETARRCRATPES